MVSTQELLELMESASAFYLFRHSPVISIKLQAGPATGYAGLNNLRDWSKFPGRWVVVGVGVAIGIGVGFLPVPVQMIRVTVRKGEHYLSGLSIPAG
jgi:hypothetical protein